MERDPYNFDNNKNPLAENLLKSYIHAPDQLEKGVVDELEKGGKKAFIGEKRDFGGRTYIKTAQGWKFFGKGTGAKAKDHHEKHAPSTAKTDEEYDKEATSITHPFKEGDKVRIDQKGAKLISLSPFEGKDLSVEKIIDTGLISEPFRAKVTDGEGSSIIVSMNDLKKVSDEVTFTPKQLKKDNYESVGVALGARSYGEFINKNGEHCQISVGYDGGKKRMRVYFMQPDKPTASRFAINTTSEKKILNLLNSEQFTRRD